MVGVQTFAHDIAVANNGKTIYYVFTNNNTELSVSFRGSKPLEYADEYWGSIVIPSSVYYNGTTYPVTSIGDIAFRDCSSLTSVTIPSSVTSIGWIAFKDCSSLSSVVIPNSVTQIGYSAFEGTALLNNMGNGVVYYNNVILGYKGNKPTGTISIKNGTRLVADGAFSGCSGLTSIVIPNSLTHIGNQSFENCSGLTSCTFGNSLKTIGGNAFYNCGFTSVTIPNSVVTIESAAFQYCSNLTSVAIGTSVSQMGDAVFAACDRLNSITFHCKEIGDGWFWFNESIKTIEIGDEVTKIGYRSFYHCTGLTSVVIPGTVKSIGESAFEGSPLTSVTMMTDTPLSITSNVFSCYSSATLYVPYRCKDVFASTDVWRYFNQIVELPASTAYIVDSSLTGETGIVAFACTEVGTLYDTWVSAGRPSKIRVSGEINRNDLYRVTHESYTYNNISYIDLSEANIEACTSNSYPYEYRKNYLDCECLGSFYDGIDYWPSILVIPDNLEELYQNGNNYSIWKIYSRQSTPCKTTLNDDCKFYVPSGSRLAWKSMTTNPRYVTFLDGPEKSINIQTAGTLQNYLTVDEIATINSLTVSGTIDARDFKTIKRMNNLVTLYLYANIVAYEGYYGPNPSQISYNEREIPAYLFQNHQNIEKITFSDSYYSVGDYAFDGCKNLISLDNIKIISLGDFCFRNTPLTSNILLIGRIGEYYEDGGFSSSFISSHELNHVGKNPFFGSKAWFTNVSSRSAQNNYDSNSDIYYVMTDYTILPDYFDYHEYGYVELLSKDKSILYSVRTGDNHKLVLTEDINTLADYAISGLNISSVDLQAVSQIGDGFLYQCPLLSEIICDNDAFTAVDGVLYSADQKTLVKYPCARDGDTYTIPSSVESISKWAFEGANNLQSFTLEAVIPPVLGEMVFENVDMNNMTLYVPAGSKALYQAADYWNEFKEIIEMENEFEPTDISLLENAIYVEPVEVQSGVTIDLDVKLKNALTAVGCSFTLILPEGVRLEKDADGDIVFELDGRARKQWVTLLDLGNGKYDCTLAPSTTAATIMGNDGALIKLRAIVPDDMAVGDYMLQLKNCMLQSKDNGTTTEHALIDVTTKLTVVDYVPGDVDGDGGLSFADVAMMANHAIGKEQTGFNAKAADMNGDERVTIADIVIIIEKILKLEQAEE